MRASHHLLVDGIVVRAFVGAVDAGARQIVAHAPRALDAAEADALQADGQPGMGGIDTQADDVHGLSAPAHRDFDAGDQGQPGLIRRGPGRGDPGHIVVVGQGEHVHAVGRGTRDDVGGRQHAVRHIGMAMQIDIEHR